MGYMKVIKIHKTHYPSDQADFDDSGKNLGQEFIGPLVFLRDTYNPGAGILKCVIVVRMLALKESCVI